MRIVYCILLFVKQNRTRSVWTNFRGEPDRPRLRPVQQCEKKGISATVRNRIDLRHLAMSEDWDALKCTVP